MAQLKTKTPPSAGPAGPSWRTPSLTTAAPLRFRRGDKDKPPAGLWPACLSSAGTADANTAARAALHVQSVLRRDYDLMPD